MARRDEADRRAGAGAPGREARLALVARRQQGVFSRRQAIETGFSTSTIGRRCQTGEWVRVHPGVYRLGGVELTWRASIHAAALAVGPTAVVTHETAALLHGAERLPAAPLTLTAPHGTHHRVEGAFVHQIDDLRPHHLRRIDGLVVSSPARAVVELGATRGEALVGRVADDVVRSGATTYAAIGTVLHELTRPGKPGILTVARVLDERGDGHVPPQSELEALLFEVLAAGGLPAPVRQLPLPGRGRVGGIADGGYLDARIVLEADGRRWHLRVEAARRDRERDAQVVAAGWVPLRFVHEQLVSDPAGVCAIVAETRERRLALLRGRPAA